MTDEVKPAAEAEHDEFADAFKDLTSGLKEPGAAAAATAAAAETPEAKAAREAAAAETPEAKAAREAAAAAATETPEAKAAREAAAAAAAETPEAKAAREAAAAETPEAKAAREAAAAATPPADSSRPSVEAQLADATRRLAELEAARAAPPKVDGAAPAEKPIYTAEEQEILNKYLADWANVRQGEELIRRAEYHHLVKFIYEQMDAKYGHLLQYVEERAPVDQYTAIVGLVPDYDAVRDKAIAWATDASQPRIVREAYKRVVDEGEPVDIRDMIEAWRKATNQQPPAASPPPVAAAGGAPTAPAANDPARAAAVAALKPVDAQRTAPASAGPDKEDFAGSFAEFAAVAR